jgi:hypothetical protein
MPFIHKLVGNLATVALNPQDCNPKKIDLENINRSGEWPFSSFFVHSRHRFQGQSMVESLSDFNLILSMISPIVETNWQALGLQRIDRSYNLAGVGA